MRPFALACAFLLSLSLTASARADEKEFQKAAAEWRALFQPLKTARMVDAGPFLDRISREGKEKNDAIRHQCDWAKSYLVLLKVQQEGWETLEELSARSNPRERRALLRRFAILGDVYEDSDVPRYPTCGTGLEAEFNHNARELFVAAVKKEPAANLGMLDDADPRVAELAALTLQIAYPDEVRRRIVQWAHSPQARFRGIAAVWAVRFEPLEPFLGEEAQLKVVHGLLDDPSEDVRDQVIDALADGEAAEEYFARRADFAKAREGRKWTALRLGIRLNDPSVGPLALASLSGGESLVKAALWATRTVKANVPKPTLLRLFRHVSSEVRKLAYQQAFVQDVSVAEIQPGFSDPEESVAEAAFDAACEKATTREEFLLLFRMAEKKEGDYSLTRAAGRLGEIAVPEIRALLADAKAERREWGVEMACVNGSKRLLPVLRGIVSDPSGDVRATLIECAYLLPKEVARDLLNRLTKDPDEKNREKALEELAELDARGEKDE